MRRRGASSIAANPVLIGAVTTLVVIVAVYLAYNANSGLPFVPTYDVRVEVPNAAGLVKGNDVRIGGTRVGTVSAMTPRTRADGSVIAVLDLALQKVVSPLPQDSTVIVRPRSALGLKYVQLTRGTADQGVPPGGTLPLRQATPAAVELDEVFDMFDEPTRRAIQQNLTTAGDAFASRGGDLSFALRDLRPLFDELTPVMRNLASSRTDLAGLIRGLARSAAVVAPVAETQGRMFESLDTTFTALAQVARPYIQDSIAEGPQTLDVATRALPRLRPFLANSTGLLRELRPGVRSLAQTAPDLADIVRIGTPVLQRSPAFNARLSDTLRAVETFSTDPVVKLGVLDLTSTARILNPALAFATPAQTVCNYIGVLLRNAAQVFGEGGTTGTVQRFMIIGAPGGVFDAPNGEGAPSSAPANGGPPGSDPANFLHSNPYPDTAAVDLAGRPVQPFQCAAGNEKFAIGKLSIGNPSSDLGTLHTPTKPTRNP